MDTTDWRRNPWVWLLIAIPAATVIGCAITVYLAVSNPDVLVSDPAAAATHGSSNHGEQ